MAKFTVWDKAMLQLIACAPDEGDGWRNISRVVWDEVCGFKHNHPKLIAIRNGSQIRLTVKGKIVAEYLL
jgi:hypothetical protein